MQEIEPVLHEIKRVFSAQERVPVEVPSSNIISTLIQEYNNYLSNERRANPRQEMGSPEPIIRTHLKGIPSELDYDKIANITQNLLDSDDQYDHEQERRVQRQTILGHDLTATKMASVRNEVSRSSGIVSLISLAVGSCTTLNRNLKSFQSKERPVRELLGEAQDLELVLRTLQDSIGNMATSMEFLMQPVNRCSNACKDFNTLITESTERSTDKQVSSKEWLKLRYLGEDIVGFKNMLAGYKATIIIALAYENMYDHFPWLLYYN